MSDMDDNKKRPAKPPERSAVFERMKAVEISPD